MSWETCSCCGKRQNWTDFDAPEVRCASSDGVDWRTPEPQKPGRVTWFTEYGFRITANVTDVTPYLFPTAHRVIRRIEQCHRMIAAHKACAERLRRTDLRVFAHAYGDDIKANARLHWKVRKARPHVIAAYRYLGVKL